MNSRAYASFFLRIWLSLWWRITAVTNGNLFRISIWSTTRQIRISSLMMNVSNFFFQWDHKRFRAFYDWIYLIFPLLFEIETIKVAWLSDQDQFITRYLPLKWKRILTNWSSRCKIDLLGNDVTDFFVHRLEISLSFNLSTLAFSLTLIKFIEKLLCKSDYVIPCWLHYKCVSNFIVWIDLLKKTICHFSSTSFGYYYLFVFYLIYRRYGYQMTKVFCIRLLASGYFIHHIRHRDISTFKKYL